MTIEKEWITKAGYVAQVVATEMGHRCGYVTLPEDHPHYGKEYVELDIDVHCGLTYGDGAKFGFDCAHLYDAKDESIMSDEYKTIYSKFPSVFDEGAVKTLAFCVAECESMAKQFKEQA